ncbi:MAG: molybdopterin molybdotransferase MoeA [Elusimicrobia bacterium]|nr:molybdopterin molybdotransferase MoeA [Elusimicrobiota bacterium]
MTPPEEALRLVLEAVSALPAAAVPLEEADGLALAEDLLAGSDAPPFDDSAMDGWALRAVDAAAPAARLRICGEIYAGAPPAALQPGCAALITTGAPLPEGADCVVPKELARAEEGTVAFDVPPEPGQHVRRRGSDFKRGEPVLGAGRMIGAFESGLLAGQGRARVMAVPRPRVALVTSGDELRRHDQALGPGQVRDASTPALCAALRSWGCVPIPVGASRDKPAELDLYLRAALAAADAVFVTGGVSVGERDLTRPALALLGAREVFWRTAVKPGKPLLFAVAGGKPVWGLPGNPVSSLVTALVFAKPALARMAGRPAGRPPFPERGTLAADFEKPAALRQFVFCEADEDGTRVALTPIVPQHSGRLSMGVRARALAVLPEGRAAFTAGFEAEFAWL